MIVYVFVYLSLNGQVSTCETKFLCCVWQESAADDGDQDTRGMCSSLCQTCPREEDVVDAPQGAPAGHRPAQVGQTLIR